MRRLDQLLANLGYCSRREAREWVEGRRVTIGARIADDPAEKCDPREVRVDGEPLDQPGGLLILMHKPVGVVCSHETREGPRVYDILPERWQRRNPVVTSIGRLDRDTSGLLLLTDQTPLVHRLTSPKHKVPKVYRATLAQDVAPDAAAAMVERFAAGTLILPEENSACHAAELRWRGPREAELTLNEGRYHQVRRMFASQGCTVTALHREKFGSLTLGDMRPGMWRLLALSALS